MAAWTPIAPPAGTWNAEIVPIRVFDPYVFDRLPTFDTGSTQGIWDSHARPVTNWTNE